MAQHRVRIIPKIAVKAWLSRGYAEARFRPHRHACRFARRGSRAFPSIPGSAKLFPGSLGKIPGYDATGIGC
jgi:hypothetical protein